MNFKEKVLNVVKGIPKGKVMSYKQVAQKAGSPQAYRVVGSIMKANKNPEIPCHRVIKSDGSLGKFNRGQKKKKDLLIKEGAWTKN